MDSGDCNLSAAFGQSRSISAWNTSEAVRQYGNALLKVVTVVVYRTGEQRENTPLQISNCLA